MRVLHPALKYGRGCADLRVEILERRSRLKPAAILVVPKRTVAEDLVLRGVSAGEKQPLHTVGGKNVVPHGEIDPGVGRGDRYDGRKMRGKFLGGGPLIVA